MTANLELIHKVFCYSVLYIGRNMLKFIRSVDKSLEDFFVLDFKALGNLIDDVDDHSPDTFRYGKFRRVSGHFAKESADSFIGRESSSRSKYVVLHGGDCGACNLRSEVTHLILSETKIPFAILEKLMISFS